MNSPEGYVCIYGEKDIKLGLMILKYLDVTRKIDLVRKDSP